MIYSELLVLSKDVSVIYLFVGSSSPASILAAVFQCYSHLVSLLPESASYLESTAALLSSLLHHDLDRSLLSFSVTVLSRAKL